MEFYPSVELAFDAGHFVEGDARCGVHPHGHRFHFHLTFHASFDSTKGYSMDLEAVDKLMHDVVAALADKPIHLLLEGVRTTPEGLAAWLLDRASSAFREVVAAKVWIDDMHTFEVRRERR